MVALALPRAPSVVFFYGLSAAGKSWCGDVMGRFTGRPVYHADEQLTDEMKDALAAARPFDDGMRDRYFAIVADEILLRRRRGPLIVTQGLYRKRHRRYLLSRIDDMDLICVRASEEVILKRLERRKNGISVASARAIARDFDAPDDADKVVDNDDDNDERGAEEGVLRQLQAFYG